MSMTTDRENSFSSSQSHVYVPSFAEKKCLHSVKEMLHHSKLMLTDGQDGWLDPKTYRFCHELRRQTIGMSCTKKISNTLITVQLYNRAMH